MNTTYSQRHPHVDDRSDVVLFVKVRYKTRGSLRSSVRISASYRLPSQTRLRPDTNIGSPRWAGWAGTKNEKE